MRVMNLLLKNQEFEALMEELGGLFVTEVQKFNTEKNGFNI